MAALEFRVLSKLLRESTVAEVLRLGLTDEHFKDQEAVKIYRYILRHWYSSDTAKTVPPLEAIRRKWPSFQLTAEEGQYGEALKGLVQELKILSFESDTRALANYFQELVDVDPKTAVAEMQSGLTKLLMLLKGRSEHLTIGDIARKAAQQYLDAKDGVIQGLSWPWECLTEDTMGKKPGELLIFYGRMKSMKTWIALKCAAHDYEVNKARVLIWSKEMSEERMLSRMASILARVDFQLFKKGALPPMLEKRTLNFLAELGHNTSSPGHIDKEKRSRGGRDILLLCGRSAPRSLEELSSHIDEYCPDVVYLDSFYHMVSARSEKLSQRWHAITVLGEDIKEQAEQTRIPWVAMAQANREGENTHGDTMKDIADADSIGRIGDLVSRIIKKKSNKTLHEEDYEVPSVTQAKHPETMSKMMRPGMPRFGKSKPTRAPIPDKAYSEEDNRKPRTGAEIAITFPGNRDGVLDAFTIHAVPGYNFEVISMNHSTEDIRRWVDEDSPKKGKLVTPDGVSKPDYAFGNLGYPGKGG